VLLSAGVFFLAGEADGADINVLLEFCGGLHGS